MRHLVLLLVAACTPVSDVKPSFKAPSDAAVTGAKGESTSAVEGAEAAVAVGRAPMTTDVACGTDGARGCGSGSPGEVLVCRNGSWQPDAPCPPAEACLMTDSGEPSCQAVLAECVDQEPGLIYCDADALRRVCLSQTKSKELPCEALERCVVVDNEAKCRCVPGAVFKSGCVVATDCTTENGGCDTHTECTMLAATRVCGPCPDGYLGDGEGGCQPQLLDLRVSCGELDPPLTPGIYAYHLRTSLLCQQLHLEGTAPQGSTVRLQGMELAASWSADVAPVTIGTTDVPIAITSDFGVTSKYMLTVERTGSQEAYLKASNASADDYFGISLAASGDTLIVGATREDSGSVDAPSSASASDSGAVYEFSSEGGEWKQLQLLKADPVQAGEAFGASVALEGDILVVGAPGADPVLWHANLAPPTRAGAAYVFVRSNGTWGTPTRLSPSGGAPGDMFGYRIALQKDLLVVGAPGSAVGGIRSGAAYVFRKSGDVWNEVQRLAPAVPVSNSRFGGAVAVDGDRLVVSAPLDSTMADASGAAYVFAQTSGMWQEQQKLYPTPAAKDGMFGWAVAVDGGAIAVTAPTVVQSGPRGQVFLFELADGTWKAAAPLVAPYPADADLYGGAMARIGNTLVIGANGESSGAQGIAGDPSRTDAYQAGAAFMYTTTDGRTWLRTTYLKAANPDAGDCFGVAIALTDSRIFVAAPYEGSASRMINGDGNNNGAEKSGAVYVFR